MAWARQSGPAIAVEGQTLAAGEARRLRRIKFVSPGYFEAMGTRIIAGRDVTWSDIEAGGRVVVISEDFARELAAEPAAALGKRLRFDGANQDAWREVIGVVQSVHEDGVYESRRRHGVLARARGEPVRGARAGRRPSRSPSAASARAPRASSKRSGRRSGP